MKQLLCIAFALCLAACATRTEQAQELAQHAGWKWQELRTDSFHLAAATAPFHSSPLLWVYIEGDGLAYVTPTEPAQDPSPNDPVALKLALHHPAGANVAYLARPCHYGLMEHCDTSYWTNARYSDTVIESLNEAMSALKTQAHASQLALAGYSGGGALAVLVAAKRHDVTQIVTVAANLDLAYWVKTHGLSPLTGSRDAADAAAATALIPQRHFTGEQDQVVGSDVTRSYMARLPAYAPAQLIVVPGYTHYCCWDEHWEKLLAD